MHQLLLILINLGPEILKPVGKFLAEYRQLVDVVIPQVVVNVPIGLIEVQMAFILSYNFF